MKNCIRTCLGILGFAALAASAAQPAAVPPLLADAFARQGVGPVENINYADEHGRPMSAYDFLAQVKRSRQFDFTKTPDDRERDVTLRLRPPGYYAFSRLRIGEAWPQFQLTRLDGTAVDNKALEGRYTLVSFYSSASSASAADVAQLNDLAARRKDLNLIAVTPDSDDDARAFVAANRFAWPVATGGGQLVKQIGVDAYPSLALFDPQGRLVAAMGRLLDAESFTWWLDEKTGAVRKVAARSGDKHAMIDFKTCDRPAYPEDDVREKHMGAVKLNFLIGADGAIRKAGIGTSSGYPSLDQAALTALSRCRFTPGTLAGVPAETWASVHYIWSIE